MPKRIQETLDSLPHDDVKALFTSGNSTSHQFGSGQMIQHEGAPCEFLGLLTKGVVRVYMLSPSGREITLYRVNQGQCCILTAACIMSDKPFPANAVTESDIKVETIPKQHVKSALLHDARWQHYLFGLVEKRLTDVFSVVKEVAFNRMDIRVASHLLQTSAVSGDAINATHQQIALELGTVREVVSRVLKEFESDGLLQLDRGKITILNGKLLRQLCNNSPLYM